MTEKSQHWPTWLTSLLVFGVACVVFAPVSQFEFLPYWDDNVNVLQNPLFHPLTAQSFSHIWFEPRQVIFYIPVTYTAWAGQVALSNWLAGPDTALNPAIFHTANLLVHAATGALVFFLLLRLLTRLDNGKSPGWRLPAAAAAGALLFALYPLQTEAVAWVTGFRDLLGAFFGFLALWLFVISGGAKKTFQHWLFYAAATLAFLLALGAKPSMVVIPAVALFLGLWPMRFSPRFLASKLIPWFALSGGWVLLTISTQTNATIAHDLVPLWAQPLVALDALAFYLGKIVCPTALSADYGRAPNTVMQSGVLYWTWLFPVALLATLAFIRRARWALVTLAIFAIALVPTLGLVPFNFQIVSTVADRYAYFALLGPALAAAIVLVSAPRWAVILGGVVLVCLAGLTSAHLRVWSDSRHLFQATLEANPRSWKAHLNYGDTLDNMDDYAEGARHIEESLRLWPGGAEGWNDLAAVYLHLGRLDQSLDAFRHSIKIRPAPSTVHNLVFTLLQADRPEEAAGVLQEAWRLNPNDLETARSLAWMLATHPNDRGRNGPKARQIAQHLVQTQSPPSGAMRVTLAAALAECGQFSEAVQEARAAMDAYQKQGVPGGVQFVSQEILPALLKGEKIRDASLVHPLQAEVEKAARRRR